MDMRNQGFPEEVVWWGIFNNRLVISGNFCDLEGQNRDRGIPSLGKTLRIGLVEFKIYETASNLSH